LAIRMESSDDDGICTCVTCGKRDHYKRMNGGHYIPRKHTAALLVEENIHVQCVHCNDSEGGNLGEYATFIIEQYGMATLEALKKLKHSDFKYTRHQLADMRDGYKKRIKLQKARLG
jgi:5-methylcytosine-specific restriction endonuclease McrA